ncbi:Origin recognition complex subunit 1 [Ceratocystis platani]|uniref:Origin recognition complex subunit 1 n=1 Tax=Ceratocystis fimbriata f. sp. platani TaxID=88771 RepID=A0A0F8AZJ0_CERFI|nr:Origin recognition complex subunit 1 [Ceratocystis platani]
MVRPSRSQSRQTASAEPTVAESVSSEDSRNYASVNGVVIDSEKGPANTSDEDEDLDWDWVYDSQDKDGRTYGRARPANQITGARLGQFECRLGDIVLLRADGLSDTWVAIISDFTLDDNGEKAAIFVWFTGGKEIRNNERKIQDYYPNELYITSASDINPLGSICGKANVMSEASYRKSFPTGKISRSSPHYGKTFICRRGCNMRTTTYTNVFVWENMYRGFRDLKSLLQYVTEGTKLSRKPKQDLDATFVPGDETAPQKKGLDKGVIRGAKKALEFTPLATRIIPMDTIQASPFQQARTQLHVAAVPLTLPCRENEFAEVYFHLEKAISNGTSNCIYISGTPGTGKTATVREVIARLEDSVLNDELDDFIFVEINGLKITDPHQSYAVLWEALKGERVSPAQALDLLEREFSAPNPRRVPCVVLMDELDQLVTKNQGVMYNFFNWPALRHSRLIVLAVANTMDLPERTLSNKISSRLGLTRIPFPGYNHEQLMKIIQSRLEGVQGNIVEPDAIQFASRKVAAVSGDARRALDICRRAVEIAESSLNNAVPATPSRTKPGFAPSNGRVTIQTIRQAINEATSNPVQQALRALPLAPKLLLSALLIQLRRAGIGEVSMGDVLSELGSMLRSSSGRNSEDLVASLLGPGAVSLTPQGTGALAPTALMAFQDAALGLVAAGIIVLEAHKVERPSKVRLAVPDDEITMAFHDDPEIKEIGITV